ncbi:GNAT family N-acetyltransferase [Aeromonas schubertii]
MAALPLSLSRRPLYPDTLVEADYPAYRALYADPRVALLTGLPARMEESAARRWFDNALALPAGQGRISALRQEGESTLCGVVRLTDWEQGAGIITLGYALSPRLWGEGLMQNCLSGLLPSLFAGALGHPLHRVQSWVQADNHRSRRLLERLGFRHEGTLRGLFRNEQGHHDICAYGLLCDDPTQRAPGEHWLLTQGAIDEYRY